MVGVEGIYDIGGAIGSETLSVSDRLRSGATYPAEPVDVPDAQPWGAWFHERFAQLADLPGAAGRGVGSFLREVLAPLYPLLIMLAVLGVIGFLILGKVRP